MIPIVFVTSTDPVAAGYVQSFARPGGNLTGFAQFEASINTKYLQLLKDIAPQIARAAVVVPSALARARADFASMEQAARSIGVTPVETVIQDNPADIERAIVDFAREPNSGLIVPPSNQAQGHRALIVALATRHRLPAVYYSRPFVEAGGLMSYGINQSDQYRQAAAYVDRILRGAKPVDLPVQTPTKFELVINLKTATALGLTIPPTLFALADEVTE
jgi:putative ABC transport system substrate-binding protein